MLNRKPILEALKGVDLSKGNNLDKVVEAIEKEITNFITCKDIEGVKRLPTDEQGNLLPRFKTDKHEYFILNENTGVPLSRFVQFKKAALAFGFNMDFQTLIDEIKAIEKDAFQAIREPEHVQKLLARTAKVKDGIIDLGKQKFDYSLFVASAVIVRTDEDVKMFDATIAEEKMQDWTEAGIAQQDFFLLIGNLVASFKENYQLLMKEKKELANQLAEDSHTQQ